VVPLPANTPIPKSRFVPAHFGLRQLGYFVSSNNTKTLLAWQMGPSGTERSTSRLGSVILSIGALIDAAPRIKMLPGERHREHVVTPEEEERYLLSAKEPLASVATVLTVVCARMSATGFAGSSFAGVADETERCW
jgi:hypothetical protein